MYFDIPSPKLEPGDIRRNSASGSYPPICLDDNHFLISQRNLDAMPEYSCTRPSGVYNGKCWKAKRSDGWWIGCYIEEDPPHPDGMLTPFRKALVVEEKL